VFLSSPFMFFGQGGVISPLVGGTASEFTVAPNVAKAGWRFNADGSIDKLSGSGWSLSQQLWYSPRTANIGASGDYWIKFELVSGFFPDTKPAFDTWWPLGGSSLTVTNEDDDGGYVQSVILASISKGGTDSAVITTGTFEIEIESAV
jgi:hypothetical protein